MNMSDFDFEEAMGGDEIDEGKVALQALAESNANYFRALRSTGLSIWESAGLTVANLFSYSLHMRQEKEKDSND